jgi:ferrous iron transport protein A
MTPQANQITHPLSEVPCGTVFYVACIEAESGLTKRLQEMGFVHQAPVIKMADQGTVICQVGHTQVVLSAEIAGQIFVQAVAIPLSSETTLDKLKAGQKARVVRFLSDDQGVFVLQEMGITHHEILELVRMAPLGDPMEIRIRGYELSLRREQARQISVEIIP